MSVRKLLLALGVVFVGAGLWLAFLWAHRPAAPSIQTVQKMRARLS